MKFNSSFTVSNLRGILMVTSSESSSYCNLSNLPRKLSMPCWEISTGLCSTKERHEVRTASMKLPLGNSDANWFISLVEVDMLWCVQVKNGCFSVFVCLINSLFYTWNLRVTFMLVPHPFYLLPQFLPCNRLTPQYRELVHGSLDPLPSLWAIVCCLWKRAVAQGHH